MGRYFGSKKSQRFVRTRRYHKYRRFMTGGAKSLARRALRMAKSAIKTQDHKFFDGHAISLASYAWTGTVVGQLITPAQGVTQSDRISDTIFVKGMNIDYQILWNTNGTSGVSQSVRLMLVRGKLENANSPAMADVLATGDLGSLFAITAQRNYQERRNWQVLYDRVHIVNNLNISKQHHRRYISIGKSIEFTPTTTTAEDGGVYLIAIGDTSSTSTTALINFQFRAWYKG